MIEVPGYKIAGTMFTKEQMQERVQELGRQISKDYEGESILMVGILKGAFVFLSDLARAVDGDVRIDFMMASSYGSGTESSGVVKIKKDMDENPAGRNILLVEDIIDTGNTLYYLKNHFLKDRKAKSIKIATMFNKRSRREVDLQPDYYGFDIEDRFIIGYGLDYDEKFRNLPDITYLVEDK